MNNFIKYYYNIDITESSILKADNNYFFENDRDLFYFEFQKLNVALLNVDNYPHYFVILNKNGETITKYNNKDYILYKIDDKYNEKINLTELISNRNYSLNKDIIINDWDILWKNKIDYYENQIREYGQKSEGVINSFSYYVGLSENAISYVNNLKKEYQNQYKDISICRRQILYPPTKLQYYLISNYIIDYNVRDYAEYVKCLFFNEDIEDCYDDVHFIIKKIYPNELNLAMFYARLVYPSYYFKAYDEIINNNANDTVINGIVNKSEAYKDFLIEVGKYISKIKPITLIDWLI